MNRILFPFLIFAWMLSPSLGADVETSITLSELIDRHIAQRWERSGLEMGPSTTDREFARRVYLDLAGRVPRPQETLEFVNDDRDDKRHQLIDRLIASEDHVQHLADTFDTLLMGRGSDGDYAERKKHGWRSFLERAFRENVPWNEVIHAIALARPVAERDRGADWFVYERKNQHQAIAEAIAPAVFGIRVECAQCHDHPLAYEIEQAHYWGLVAFYNRSKNVNTKNGPRVEESAIGGFSEFADLTGDSSPNLLTFFGADVVPEDRPGKDEKQNDADDLYRSASKDGDPRVPKFSRRERFADDVVASHPLVSRAMVNRVWAMLMGRGMVHPFDQMDSMHDPSHPELLDALDEDFRSSGYDVRRLVRAIVNSRAYQLSSVRQSNSDDPADFASYLDRPLTAEQMARSIQLILRGEFRNDSPLVNQLRARLGEVMPEESVTTVKDALFLTNNVAINDYIATSQESSHLIATLSQSSKPEAVNLLFETVYSRTPTAEEQKRVVEFLGESPSRDDWCHLVWSLLTSAEFRFNH